MQLRRLSSLLAILLAALIALSGAASQISPQQPEASKTDDTPEPHILYPVVRVSDGDTFVIRKDGNDVKVRLIGLDTPEIVDPRKPVQCFGRAASDEAHRVLDDSVVRLETDSSQDTYDKYGRLLAYAFVQSSTTELFFNKHMIEYGFGHEYTYRDPYRYQTEFKAAQQTARNLGRGLWAAGACGN